MGNGGLGVESDAETLAIGLALAATTLRPLHWEGFRRRGTGLSRDEAAITAFFRKLSDATAKGGGEGDKELRFEAGEIRPGSYDAELDGSVLGLVQAAAIPLSFAGGPSEVLLTGTTHPSDGPTFEVVRSTWLHVVRRMGFDVELHLERAGFAPRGGGRVRAVIRPPRAPLRALDLSERGTLASVQIVSAGASVPGHVQQRQAARARSGVSIGGLSPTVQLVKLDAARAGSVVAITGIFDGLPITVASVSARGVSAEVVGERAATAFRSVLVHESVVPAELVGSLLLASAFGTGASTLTTKRLLPRVAGQARLIAAFTGREVQIQGKAGKPATLRLQSRDPGPILNGT